MTKPKDNTAKLIRTGNLLVTLPTVVALFAPLLVVGAEFVRGGDFRFARFVMALAGGVVLSFFVYRYASRRWLTWALRTATDLPALKRKAIQHNLINERGRSLVSASHTLGQSLTDQLEEINDQVAMHDNLEVPQEKIFRSSSGYRMVAWVTLCMYIVATSCTLIFLSRPIVWDFLQFVPLLVISIIYFIKKEKVTTVLQLDESGMKHAGGFISWEEVKTVRFRRAMRTSRGVNGISTRQHNYSYLDIELKDGKLQAISLQSLPVSHTIEDVIAVYRYRHQRVWAGL